MTLRVQNVPAPAPGRDWETVVPGQYVWNVISVTATLNQPAPPLSTAVDSSGNGHDGTYTNTVGTQTYVPGLVTGDTAVNFSNGAGAYKTTVGLPVGITQYRSPWSVEFWVGDGGVAGWQGNVWTSADVSTNHVLEIIMDAGPNGFIRLNMDGNVSQWSTAPGSIPDDGNPRYIVISYDGTVPTVRVNALVVPWAVSDVPPAVAIAQVTGTIGGFFPNNPGSLAVIDEFALYDYELGAGQIVGHWNASFTGFADYNTAVLADLPAAYYHLDSNPPPAPRTVCLDVSDGTNFVETFPPPPPGTGVRSALYTWLTSAVSSTTTPDGAVVVDDIAPLILPAGYTLGSRTFDLGVTDEWSDIAVWWNDDRMVGSLPVDYHNILITG